MYKENYLSILQNAQFYINESINSTDFKKSSTSRLSAIKEYDKLLNEIDVREYLLIDSKPQVPKDIYIQILFNIGTLYKTHAEQEIASKIQENNFVFNDYYLKVFQKANSYFRTLLKVDIDNDIAIKQLTSIYTQLCAYNKNDYKKCLEFLQEALIYSSVVPTIHYNLGFIYQKINQLEYSLIHYRIALKLCDTYSFDSETDKTKLILNIYNGLSGIFRSIKQWPESLYYLQQAEKVDDEDPDVQNQLGVVYTEMRRTDLAEIAYNKAIENYKKSFITNDHTTLLSDLYLNLGHMHSYNGDNSKSIECYNQSLKVLPTANLAFQNKIMNLTYLFDDLEDKKYIFNQHKLINKIFKSHNKKYKFDKKYFTTPKINIGIISGDFADHPVQFFISTFLKNFDQSRLEITCYSECIINTQMYNQNLKFKFIKHMSTDKVSDIIYNDNIHILFDLAGHTAFNRLDVFKQKPAPIQITYIGYPYSTGLNEMDYRITDSMCDHSEISQKFYTEKLLFLKDCFLCYNPDNLLDPSYKYPDLVKQQPFIQHKKEFLTIACFNRLNKMTDNVVKLFNNILLKYDNVKFVFKTKALLNENIKINFINKFDKNVQSRIDIKDCTLTHEEHLLEYNNIDISIDTFPYSGTTTSCESLLQGVPVFTLYDSTYYFHAQNVTASILSNSHDELKYFICNDQTDMINKIGELLQKPDDYWNNLKLNTRNQFLNGNVCNKSVYMDNMHNLLTDLFNKHKSKY